MATTTNRTSSVATRITPEEKAQYKALAQAKGISVSELLRQAVELMASQPIPVKAVEPKTKAKSKAKVKPLLLPPAPEPEIVETTPVETTSVETTSYQHLLDNADDPEYTLKLCEYNKDSGVMIKELFSNVINQISYDSDSDTEEYIDLRRFVIKELVESTLLKIIGGRYYFTHEEILQNLDIRNPDEINEILRSDMLDDNQDFWIDLENELGYEDNRRIVEAFIDYYDSQE